MDLTQTNGERFSFRQRLAAGFLMMLLALAGLVITFYKNNENFISTSRQTAHTNHVLYQSEQVISLAKDVETATRGFLLSRERRFLAPFFQGKDQADAHIQALSRLTADNKSQQERIVIISRLVQERIQLSQRQISLLEEHGAVTPAIIELSRRGLVLMDSLRLVVAALQGEEQRLLTLRQQANDEAISATRQLVLIGGIGASLLLIVGWIVINRNFRARISAENRTKELNDSLERKVAERSEALVRVEQLLRHTLDNMVEGVQIIDFNWRYIYVNEALMKQSRFKSSDQLVGLTVMDLYPGVEKTELFGALKQCMEERIPVSLQTEFQFPDRSSDWFELSFQPVPDGIFILSTETTRQRQAAKVIIEQKAFAESLLLAAPDGIMGIDAYGRITLINTQAERIFGYRPQEMIGRSIQLLLPDGAIEMFNADSHKAGRHPGVFKKEFLGMRKNGELFPLDVSWSFLHTGDSHTLIGSFQDITEKKRAEAEIEHLTEHLEETVRIRTAQLEAINKELDSFSYSVSHDLRAPLRAIDGYTRILIEEHGSQVNQEGRNTMEVIRRSAKRMGQLIDDLLAFSRLGKQSLVAASVNMSTIVQGVVSEYQGQSPGQLRFVINSLPPVSGDASMLKQVLSNLVSNAVKYSSKNEQAVVEIGSYSENGRVVYYVKDNGAGFDMLYYDKLFGVFQRLHSTKDFEGTGVGLAIVHRIIHRHGGEVWAHAKENEGAVFYFSLPKEEDLEM